MQCRVPFTLRKFLAAGLSFSRRPGSPPPFVQQRGQKYIRSEQRTALVIIFTIRTNMINLRPETVVFLTSWQIQMKTVERNGMRQLKWLEEIVFSFRKGVVRNGPGFDPSWLQP